VKKAALSYFNKGKSIIPVGQDKKPLIHWLDFQKKKPTYHQIQLWWDQWPDANIALPTGPLNGVVVVDCDSDEANEAFLGKYPEAKDTLTVKTPRGYHYYFKFEEGIRNDAGKKLGKGVDIRGDGGYVLVPPSVNATGDHYSWINSVTPRPLGESLRSALSSPAGDTGVSDGDDGKVRGTAVGKFGPGERNQQLTKVAGSLRRYGLEGEALVEALSKVNTEQCDPPLTEKEIRTIAKSVQRYQPEDVVTAEPNGDTLIEVPLDQVTEEEVSWLWHNRIPFGRITLIEGDPGVCKSWLTLAIATAVSTGESLPGKAEDGQLPRSTGKIILFSAEDTLSDTVKPRLRKQGADQSKVIAIQGVLDANGERGISLRDLKHIENIVRKHQAKLVIIDPIVAYVSGADANRAQDVRGLLAPLGKLAERNGTAFVLVRHLNKTTDQKAGYRGQGSIDWLAACRSAFMVIPDVNDKSLRYVVHTKNSLAPLTPTLTFSTANEKVDWVGECWLTADELLKQKKVKTDGTGSEGNYKDWNDKDSGESVF